MPQYRRTIHRVGRRPLAVAPVGSLFASGVDRRQPETSSAILRGEKLRAQRGGSWRNNAQELAFSRSFVAVSFLRFLFSLKLRFRFHRTLPQSCEQTCCAVCFRLLLFLLLLAVWLFTASTLGADPPNRQISYSPSLKDRRWLPWL